MPSMLGQRSVSSASGVLPSSSAVGGNSHEPLLHFHTPPALSQLRCSNRSSMMSAMEIDGAIEPYTRATARNTAKKRLPEIDIGVFMFPSVRSRFPTDLMRRRDDSCLPRACRGARVESLIQPSGSTFFQEVGQGLKGKGWPAR